MSGDDYMTLVEALTLASRHAGRGVACFPIAISPHPDKPGRLAKRPLTDHGHKDATTDQVLLAAMFQDADDRLKPGEALGVGWLPASIGAVIFDGDQHEPGQDGRAYIESVLCLPPHTTMYDTPTGNGRHFVLLKRDDQAITNVSPWTNDGVDVRSDNGWGVAPGTRTPWGSWTLVPGKPALGETAAMVPLAVWEQLVDATEHKAAAKAATVTAAPVDLDSVPVQLAERLADYGPTWVLTGGSDDLFGKVTNDRSAVFMSLINAIKAEGYTQSEAVTLLTPWCDAVRKYGKGDGNRVPAQVTNAWSKCYAGRDETDDSAGDEVQADGDGDKAEGSTRARIVRVAKHRYRIGLTLDEQPFIVPNTGPNVALLSARAKRDLGYAVSGDGRKPPGRTPLDEAWQTVEGIAYRQPKEALPMRVGQTGDGAVVLDLGDAAGRAVLITEDGWEIVDRSPITFRRPKTMLPLPTPERGKPIDALWSIVNIDPDHRHLATAWLACTLLPGFPHAIVQIRGEQGSAKTTAAVTMGRLVDPCVADLVGPPRDDAHWMSMAGARWVLPVDNVSHIQPWWSDSLARATTGAGDLKRALYTDSEVSAVAFKLCIILNGIALSSALRSDLAERLIPFDLRRPDTYMQAAEVDTRFDGMHAGVLGALLTIAAGILASQRRGEVVTPTDLRMADMAAALAHYDSVVGATGPTSALGAYRDQVADAFAEALDSDPVARALLTFMEGRPEWSGTVGELLHHLEVVREASRLFGGGEDGTWWATSPTALGRNLPRSAPVLARHGLSVRETGRTNRGRQVRITRSTE